MTQTLTPLTPSGPKTNGRRVCQWIETHCVLTNGRWAGQPFILERWQKSLIYGLFALDPETSLRLKRWAYIQIAKKNGKTELAAALGLYFLLGDDEPAPLVVCAASSDEQADLVFGAAKAMCELSPTLSKLTETYDKRILVPSVYGAILQRVSSNSGSLDGKHIHAVICDELHEWRGQKGEQLWNVLTGGSGARTQPMVLQITTAGFDQDSVCYKQYEWAQRVIEDPTVDPAYFGYVREAPREASLLDEEALRSANPNFGVTVHMPFFQDQSTKKKESTYRRYYLDQWVESEDIWEAAGLWPDLASDDELRPDLPVCVGIDASLKSDSTAVSIAQVQGDLVVTRTRIWENPFPHTDSRHSTYKTPIGEVEAYLLQVRNDYPLPARILDGVAYPGPAFFYDPALFDRSAMLLAGEGLTMVDYPQSDMRMIPVAQTLYELIKRGLITHEGSPAVARQMRSVIADERHRGWRISKPKGSRKRIDAAIALGIAAYEATRTAEPETQSVYERRGLQTL